MWSRAAGFGKRNCQSGESSNARANARDASSTDWRVSGSIAMDSTRSRLELRLRGAVTGGRRSELDLLEQRPGPIRDAREGEELRPLAEPEGLAFATDQQHRPEVIERGDGQVARAGLTFGDRRR